MDGIQFKTRVSVDAYDKHGHHFMRALDNEENFIVDAGKAAAMNILSGLIDTWPQSRRIFRLAIGDDGAVSGQPFVPRTPDGTWPAFTTLFHEVGRQDITAISSPATKQAQFLTTVVSSNYSPGNFSAVPRVINEAGLIINRGVPISGVTQPPAIPAADELLFSLRTFKSVPFDPSDSVTVVLLWNVFVA